MAEWRWYACDLRTGILRSELPLNPSGAVVRAIGAVGTGEFDLPLTDPATPADWALSTLPGRSVIVGEVDRVIVWAGIVWTRTWSDSGTVSLGCSTLESYLERRYLDYTVGPYKQADHSDIMRGLFTHANHTSAIGADGILVDAPPTGRRSDRTEYTRAADMSVFDAVSNLSNTQHGPEWTIDVEWDPTSAVRRLRYIARVRYKYLGVRRENPEWVLNSPGNIVSWELVEDYSDGNFATAAVVTGQGDGDAVQQSAPNAANDAQLHADGWPLMEIRRSVQINDTSANKGKLNEIARGSLAAARNGTRTIQLTARTSQIAYGLGIFGLGDACRIRIERPGADEINDVWRVVGWSIDPTADTITPTLAPYEEPYEVWVNGELEQ